ncbi:MAG: DUF4442 domain-containing protein [Saprospiraceae bacterium]|nr:DUF4442 domain-containing protein [Candidatus Opimibacter iunctus]
MLQNLVQKLPPGNSVSGCSKLPMGLLSGMYIQSLDENRCVVVLKERWWITNPFGSVFWAVMGMAAELSTGALVYAHVQGPKVQFILVGMEGNFLRRRKAKVTIFVETGSEVLRSIEQIVNPNEKHRYIAGNSQR